MADVTPAATDRKIGWVREAAGPRFASLEPNILPSFTKVTDDRQGTLEQVAATWKVDPAMYGQTPHALIGTLEEVREQFLAQQERHGISYVTVFEDAMEPLGPVVAALAGT